MNKYPEEFNQLLAEDNFLGAWVWVKSGLHDPVLQAACAGELAKKLLARLEECKAEKNRESEAWYRSNLAYVLRDYPGLGALYREQTRIGVREQSPQDRIRTGVEDALRDFSDVAEGRVTLEEKLKETLDNAGAQVRETMAGTPIFSGIAKGIGEGLQELGKLFTSPPGGAASRSSANKEEARQERPAERGKSGEESTSGSADSPKIKVKIENADDPLPHPLEKADPAE